MKRLQLRHHDELFATRETALAFFSDILNPNHVNSGKFGTSLYAEPMVAKYKDNEGKTQILFAIGTDTPDAPYHIIDSADILEKINFNSLNITEESNRAIEAEAVLSGNIITEIERAKSEEKKIDDKISTEINERISGDAKLAQQISEEIVARKEADNAEAKAREEAINSLNESINNNITYIASVTPNGANIREAFVLKNNKGEILGDTINIYKDSSLVGVTIGFKGASSVVKENDGTFTLTYSESERDENIEYLYLIYKDEEGNLRLVGIDFENFLMEAEFGEGIKVINHIASIHLKEGEKYLAVNKENGLYTVNIDEAINNAVENASININAKIDEEVKKSNETDEYIKTLISEFSAATVANITNTNILIDEEQERALSEEKLLNDSILSLSGAVDTERNERKNEDDEIKSEIKSNQISSKDLVVTKTPNGTSLTLQTDEVTITKMADAGTIYDTNIAVLGTLLKIKKVEPISTHIKSRYELQGADGKIIGDPIEMMVESALIDVKQGKEGASIDPNTGSYTEGTGDITMDFIYRLENGTYKLVQILVSEYFTDSHFGRGLNNQDGVVSLLEGDGNEYLVIGEDTIAVIGVDNAIKNAKDDAILEASKISSTYTDLIASGINTNISTIQDSVKKSLELITESYTSLVEEEVKNVKTTIATEVSTRQIEDLKITSALTNEIINRQAADDNLVQQIENAKISVIENAKTEAEKIAREEVAKIVDGADSSYDTLKEIAEWIINDTTGSAQMANDIQQLKNDVEKLNGDKTIIGSVEHTASDVIDHKMIYNNIPINTITPEDAKEYSLLRPIIVNDTKYYYVSNKATEMLYVSETGTIINLNDYITSLENSVNGLNSEITALNDKIKKEETRAITVETDLNNKLENVKAENDNLKSEIEDLKTRIEVLENEKETVSPEEVKSIIKEYLTGIENEIKIESNTDDSKLTIGFADDAIFG